MNKKVIYALCHQEIFFPGVGQMGKTITINNPQYKFARDLQMSWCPDGLELVFRGRSFLVPAPNVAAVEFAPEEPKAAIKKVS